jgi:cytochrome c biogenesis protein CcmG/thiol:disulfide interchange protein DsbE
VNRSVLFVGGAVVVPLVAFLALGLGKDPKRMESPLIGRSAPAIALDDLAGQRFDSKSKLGRPMLVNFWATWCVPCIAEHEVLRAAARRHSGQVEFIGVIYNDEPEAIRSFLAQRGPWGRTLVDRSVATAIAYGVYGVPESFVIDRQGKIVKKFTGAMNAAELEAALESVL